jgi:hypothetical protein
LFGRSQFHRNVKPIENPTSGQVTTINGLGKFAGPAGSINDACGTLGESGRAAHSIRRQASGS